MSESKQNRTERHFNIKLVGDTNMTSDLLHELLCKAVHEQDSDAWMRLQIWVHDIVVSQSFADIVEEQ